MSSLLLEVLCLEFKVTDPVHQRCYLPQHLVVVSACVSFLLETTLEYFQRRFIVHLEFSEVDEVKIVLIRFVQVAILLPPYVFGSLCVVLWIR